MNTLVVNLQWPRVPCFAHRLQLAVKACLVLPTFINAFSVLGHFRHSYLAKKALQEKQEQLHTPKRNSILPIGIVLITC